MIFTLMILKTVTLPIFQLFYYETYTATGLAGLDPKSELPSVFEREKHSFFRYSDNDSGLLAAEPDTPNSAQDMAYTMNFNRSLSTLPQVCLSICGYQDNNQGLMQIQISTQSITVNSFVIRVVSNAYSQWVKLDMNYLVSTKREIEIGAVSALRPVYSNGVINVQYTANVAVNA